ncbi:unnamed protein product, partial [Allacma fusca]
MKSITAEETETVVFDERPKNCAESDEAGFSWDAGNGAPTLLLIELRKQFNHKFDNPKKTKKSLWSDIATQMQKKQYEVDGFKCKKKWDNLVSTYKSRKGKQNLTGRGALKCWKFEREMEDILGRKRSIAPPSNYLASTIISGPKSPGQDSTVSDSIIHENEELDFGSEDVDVCAKKKRKQEKPLWVAEVLDQNLICQEQMWEKFAALENSKLEKMKELEERKINAINDMEEKRLDLENRKVGLLQSILEKLN